MLHLCIKGIVDNVVLTIPFGFGVSFLVRIKARDFVWLPFAVGLVFEISQLIISLAFRSGFRAVDINDVLLNGTGVLIGYVAFRLFAWTYLRTAECFHFRYKWLLADIYDVAVQVEATGRLSKGA
jgi:glycopeptide antibiotics resistance protein